MLFEKQRRSLKVRRLVEPPLPARLQPELTIQQSFWSDLSFQANQGIIDLLPGSHPTGTVNAFQLLQQFRPLPFTGGYHVNDSPFTKHH